MRYAICYAWNETTGETVFQGSICGYTGSTAQAYAEQNAYTFTSGGEAPNYIKGGMTWTLEDGVLTISGNGEMADYDNSMNRPPWYEERGNIKRIVFGEGITYIGKRAFADCTALEMVKIPGSVEIIGQSAFYNCTAMTRACLLDGVKFVGGSAFSGCTALFWIRIPKSVTIIGECAFEDTIWFQKQQQETPLVIINNIVVDGKNVRAVSRFRRA